MVSQINHLHAREGIAVSLESQGGGEAIASVLIQTSLDKDAHGGKMLHDSTCMHMISIHPIRVFIPGRPTQKLGLGARNGGKVSHGLRLVGLGQNAKDTQLDTCLDASEGSRLQAQNDLSVFCITGASVDMQDARLTHLSPAVPQNRFLRCLHGLHQGPSCIHQLEACIGITLAKGFRVLLHLLQQVRQGFRSTRGDGHLGIDGGSIRAIELRHFGGSSRVSQKQRIDFDNQYLIEEKGAWGVRGSNGNPGINQTRSSVHEG